MMFFASLRDQRRSARQWITTPIQIHLGKSRIDGTTLNLSEHGMYMFTAADIPLGSEIKLVFRPPDEKILVAASAIVRRKVVYLYGIEFQSKTIHPLDHATLTPESLPDTQQISTE